MKDKRKGSDLAKPRLSHKERFALPGAGKRGIFCRL